jgi:hypothetical protein
MPVRRDGAVAAFLQALSTREGAFLLEQSLKIRDKEGKFAEFGYLPLLIEKTRIHAGSFRR